MEIRTRFCNTVKFCAIHQLQLRKIGYQFENISAKSVASAFVRHKKCKPFTRHHSGSTATLNLIPWTTVLLQKLTVPQLFKKFSAFYANQQVHHCIHKFQPLVPNPSKMLPVRALQSQHSRIHFNIIVPSSHTSFKWYHSLMFTHKTPVWISFPFQSVNIHLGAHVKLGMILKFYKIPSV